jgi:glycosyltransferase involved in cell wall biosynthesis
VLLNELGITPDVFSFTSEMVARDVGKFLGLGKLRFNYKQIAPFSVPRGWMWQILAINLMTRSCHRQYDLVFNSNNTLHGLDPQANYLHYIYFPLAVNAQGLIYFHEYRGSSPRALYGRIITRLLQSTGKVSSDFPIYAISQFTSDAILQVYPEYQGKVVIIYPPSFDGTINTETNRTTRCVTVGSISPDKNQLQQASIASQLPELEFWIIGSVKSKSYYRKCQKYISSQGLNHVQMMTNLPYAELQKALSQASFVLHTKPDEHFGISTVEAIAAGCIPIIHNSGGQREVVNLDHLRFDTVEKAPCIFRNLLAATPDELAEIRQTLQCHIQKFSREAFRQAMREVLVKRL